jgi:hypothetical protein
VSADTVFTFKLTATDNGGATSSATTNVTVKNVNVPPTVSAGAAQTVNGNATVKLSGTATDSDGTIASYGWTQTSGPVVSIANANAAIASFVAPVTTADTVLGFKLTVTDNSGASVSATTSVTVKIGVKLVVTGYSTTATKLPIGGTITVSNTIQNQGSATMPAGVYANIYMSTDATITTGDILIGTRWVPALAAGASSTDNTVLSIPVSVTPGAYYVGVIENAYIPTTVSNFKLNAVLDDDLVMKAVSASVTSLKLSASTTVNYTVHNKGTSPTTNSYAIGIYLSKDKTITTADTLIGYRTGPALAAGASASDSTIVTVPASLATRTYYLGAIADYTSAQPETTEKNNVLAGAAISITK